MQTYRILIECININQKIGYYQTLEINSKDKDIAIEIIKKECCEDGYSVSIDEVEQIPSPLSNQNLGILTFTGKAFFKL